MASDDGGGVGDVIEPARGSEFAKLILGGLACCGVIFVVPLAIVADKPGKKDVEGVLLGLGIALAVVVIASTWSYLVHGTHRLVVTADELVYIKGSKEQRYRRAEIASVRVHNYVKSEVIAVCTTDKRLFMVSYGWWGRKAAERLAELLGVPLLT